MSVVEVTDGTFDQEVRQAAGPVLIDVWAPWCGPCKMVGPAVGRIAEESPGRFKLVMANLEEFGETAASMNVRVTPTLILFDGGEEIARTSGAMMPSQIKQWLDDTIGGGDRAES